MNPQAILRVRDLAAAAAYYCDKLGFTPAGPGGTAGTMLLREPGGAVLLLAGPAADLSAWGGQPAAPGAWVYLHRADLDACAADLAARGVTAFRGPREPYPGYRHLQVTDPDGYVIEYWTTCPLDDDTVLAIYRTGPARLAAAVAGLDEAGLNLERGPGKWTIRQIVHHVVDAEMGTFQVLCMALSDPGRVIQPNLWDPDARVRGLAHAQRPIGPALDLLAAVRAWILSVLAHLPDGLDREAAWPSGYRAPVRRLLQQVGGHALHHIGQIQEVRAQYGR